jgi:hypothetical protein
MTVKAVWHIVKESARSIECPNWRRTICGGPVLSSAMLRDGSWSRSNFSWGTFQHRRPNATWVASSEFDPPSMIGLASSRILELGARLWKVCRPLAQKDRVCEHKLGF